MSKQGWIKLHRSLLDNSVWQETPFSEGQAFVDLLLLAETTEKDITLNGQAFTQVPGAVYLSKAFLMERWGWSRRRIDRIFRKWIDEQIIVHKNVHKGGSIITLVNWGKFQGSRPKSVHINEHKTVQHLKNNKEVVGEALEAPSSDSGDVICYLDENGNWKVRM